MKLRQRIDNLQESLKQSGLSGAILFHSRDIFYYTGTAQPAFLIVLPDDIALFVRRGYDLARRESFLESEHLVHGKNLSSMISKMFPGPGSGEKVGTELDLISLALANQFKQALGDRDLVDVSGHISNQRMVKDSTEIESIKTACAAVHAGHLAVLAILRPDISELELAAAVENAQRIAGHEGCFFVRSLDFVMSRGPLASGPNLRETSGTLFTLSGAGLSSAVPTGPSRRTIEYGDLVLVDIPACINGYHADQSRTYYVGGQSTEAEDLFFKLREVSDWVISHLLPEAQCDEIYALAHSKADELGIGEAFMRFESGAKAHFIGHGIGLELNEHPILAANSTARLRNQTVVAVEIHVMKPGGPALKLEDTVLVTSRGGQVLTESPRELISASDLHMSSYSAGFYGSPRAW